MSRAPIYSALVVAAGLAGCATPTLGPPPPGARPPPPAAFRAEDFAWSTEPGHGGITGHIAYREGETRFSCAHATVILTPETPWTRRRMHVLYHSTEAAADPADEVRARTPQAPAGDYSAYVRRTTCDAASHFTFTDLPDGAWYAITIAKPATGGGRSMALMRRVVTRSGHVAAAAL